MNCRCQTIALINHHVPADTYDWILIKGMIASFHQGIFFFKLPWSVEILENDQLKPIISSFEDQFHDQIRDYLGPNIATYLMKSHTQSRREIFLSFIIAFFFIHTLYKFL